VELPIEQSENDVEGRGRKRLLPGLHYRIMIYRNSTVKTY
jgi:hypothetical protein